MLRDILVELPGVSTWPCDEINYIWRHGNAAYPSDEFSPEMATSEVCNYISRQFDKIANASRANIVVEKTCANSLRVGFVNKVVPDARYIFITRDGIDTVASALERWHASLDLGYVLRKARYIPLTDFPYYLLRYVSNHMHRAFSKEKRLSFWGPLLDNMDELLEKYSVAEVSAFQWQACVKNAERDFSAIEANRIYRIRYEDFVRSPVTEFANVAAFLEVPVPETVNNYLRNKISTHSLGKGRKSLDAEIVARLELILDRTLKKYGYD